MLFPCGLSAEKPRKLSSARMQNTTKPKGLSKPEEESSKTFIGTKIHQSTIQTPEKSCKQTQL